MDEVFFKQLKEVTRSPPDHSVLWIATLVLEDSAEKALRVLVVSILDISIAV